MSAAELVYSLMEQDERLELFEKLARRNIDDSSIMEDLLRAVEPLLPNGQTSYRWLSEIFSDGIAQ